jgi:uncharacterized protein (TIGR01777 family)
MKWLLAGASGFLGQALRVRLAGEGHDVVRLVRREPASAAEFRWDPDAGQVDPAAFADVGAVVNLGGVGVASGLWTTRRREQILSSRVNTTRTLARALAERAGTGPSPVYLHASGIARYGTTSGREPYTEDSPAASDYLAQVTLQWEQAADPARAAGVRVVALRTSPVLHHSGGSFVPMKLAWSAGLGATIGDGRQRMPMIALSDWLGAVQWAADVPHASGAYNLTIPQPTTNAEFTEALARALHRPRVLAAPKFVLRTALGELAEQLAGDVYVVPQRLTADGFVFGAPDVASTIAAALAPG